MVDYVVKGPPAWRPGHPGDLHRDVILLGPHRAVKNAAEKPGISRQTLHAMLSEKSAVTPATGMRLGKLRGNGAGIWLRMQQAHDLCQAERDLAAAVRKIPTMRAA